jgi:hypothetical protein
MLGARDELAVNQKVAIDSVTHFQVQSSGWREDEFSVTRRDSQSSRTQRHLSHFPSPSELPFQNGIFKKKENRGRI